MHTIAKNGETIAQFTRHEDASHYLTMLYREAIVKGYDTRFDDPEDLIIETPSGEERYRLA